MAVNYWQGTTGNWNTAGNWSLNAVPVGDDEVIFDDRVTQAVTTGPTTKGVQYDLLHVKKGFTGNVGSSSERIHCQPSKVIFEGSGTMYLECSAADATTDSIIPHIIINSESGTFYLTSDVNTASWVSEITTVMAIQGTLYIGDSNIDTDVRNLYLMPKDNRSSALTVYIKEDCQRYKATTARMYIYMMNGNCTCDSGVHTIYMYNGTFTYGTDLGASPETGMDIEYLYQLGGTFYWNPDDNGNDAYIDFAYISGNAVFDASSVTNNDRTKYFGTSSAFLFEGATANFANGKGNNLLTGSIFYNFGGNLILDNYTKIAPTYDEG